ncbi:Gustatory receptor 178, partial [Halyomorpha halys]
MLSAFKSVLPPRKCLRSLRTALNVAAVLGVVPYSLQGNDIVLVTYRLPYYIFSVFILPLLGAYALLSPNSILSHFFPTLVFSTQYVFYTLSIVVMFICNIAYCRDFEVATRQLLKIERMLFLLDAEPKISYKFWRGVLDVLMIGSCSAAHLIIDGKKYSPEVATFLTFHYGNLRLFAFGNLVLFFLDMIHHYLDTLVNQASSSQSVLVKLSIIHDRLAEMVGIIQKVYGFPVLVLVFTTFFYVNINIFIAVKVSDQPVAVVIFGWICIMSSLIFRISNACRRIKEK